MPPLPRFSRRVLLNTVFWDPRWPVIGPHEGRAVWLMRQGWKPAAYFCDLENFIADSEASSLFALAEAGIAERYVRPIPAMAPARHSFALQEVIYVLPEQRHLVAVLRRCADEWAKRAPDIAYRREAIFAGALGYGAEDIRAFVWRVYG